LATILLTGGAGYIGSHACVALLSRGDRVVVVDDLSNSTPEALDAVAEICGRRAVFHRGDVGDAAFIGSVFAAEDIDAVIHFAGAKAVAESKSQPLRYYANNVCGTVTLLEAMQRAGVRTLVFSSSATVYDPGQPVPLTETARLGPINPYGRTKLIVEDVLRDVAAADTAAAGTAGAGTAWRISLLRYFNPVGAHASGLIGEDPHDVPNNLMPFITQVAVGRRERLSVFGNDYPTPDGTGVRDYIHVLDLVDGHLRALDFLAANAGVHVHNLGTGRGHSVLEVVAAFERASGRSIPYTIAPRRPGDAAASWADPTRAREELGWQATRDLDAMCRDAWNWQRRNPNGYRQ
jgi:UDP-glucose 4-epimerase